MNHQRRKLFLLRASRLKIATKKKNSRSIEKRKSKYDCVELLTEIDGINGYHASCYKYYCSININNNSIDSIDRKLYL